MKTINKLIISILATILLIGLTGCIESPPEEIDTTPYCIEDIFIIDITYKDDMMKIKYELYGEKGSETVHIPDNETMSIIDEAIKYFSGHVNICFVYEGYDKYIDSVEILLED